MAEPLVLVLVLRPGQRKQLLAYALGCVLVAVVCAVVSALQGVGHNGGRSGYFVPILAVVAAVNAVFLVDTAFGRTVVDQEGVTLWRPLRRRVVRWDDVDAFEQKESGDGDVSRVLLRTGSGRRRVLPAPMNASWGLDNDLGAEVRELRERLAMVRGEVGVGGRSA